MWQVQLQLMKQRILFHCLGRLQITGQTLQFVDTAQPKSFAPEQKLCFFFLPFIFIRTHYTINTACTCTGFEESCDCVNCQFMTDCVSAADSQKCGVQFLFHLLQRLVPCVTNFILFFCCYLLLPAPQQWFDCVSAHVQWAAEQLHWNKLGLCPDVPCCFPCVSSRAVSAPLPPWQRRDKHFHLSF